MPRRTKRSRKPSRRRAEHKKPRILGVPGHKSAPARALKYTREYCLIGDREADPSECRSLMPFIPAHPMSSLSPLHQIAVHFPQHVRHLRANMPDARKGDARKGNTRKGNTRKGALAHRTSKRGAKRRRPT